MVDKHSQSFFGQSTGLTIRSSSKTEQFIFLKCIKKKPDGSWEKPSLGEGKTIKCSLDEIVMILDVLNRNRASWTSFHNFNDVKTQISFKWEDDTKQKLLIYIGKYSKMLKFAQIEIFKLLLKHILKEKIEFATVLNFDAVNKKVIFHKDIDQINKRNDSKTLPIVTETVERKESEVSQIKGVIEGETEKALLIQFNEDKEVWIPKSIIRSEYDTSVKVSTQNFLIDNWILKRNNINTN